MIQTIFNFNGFLKEIRKLNEKGKEKKEATSALFTLRDCFPERYREYDNELYKRYYAQKGERK